MECTAKTLKGTITAIVTPFSKDGSSVDYQSLEKLIESQIKSGVDGIVTCGSTGEASTLSDNEYRDVVKFTAQLIKGRILTIGAVGSNNTQRAVEQGRICEQAGQDALLVVAPAYNKPPQEGLLAHFREVRKGVKIPVVAYNIPGRTGVNMQPQTLARLAEEGTIVGLKDATGSIDQALDLAALTGDSLAVLSGEDSLVLPLMSIGGRGVISASANADVEGFLKITDSFLSGDIDAARRAQLAVLPLVRMMFSETNPIPVKAALALKGIISYPTVRLPLVAAQPKTVEGLKRIFGL